MSVASAPVCPEGRNLLEGRVVAVTAAAGTGIGYATALRCAQEGAIVVLSDRHERRLREAGEALAAATGSEPLTVPCDVRRQSDVVVVLSHCGLESDSLLAREVPGIDVIVAGHTHTLINTFDRGTPIVSARRIIR